MASVPVPRTWVAGEVVTATQMNSNISDVLTFALAPPIAELLQTVVQSIGNAAFTAFTFDAEVVDSAGGHSTSVNPSRYTAVYPGYYEFSGGLCFSTNATGIRQTLWQVNGNTVYEGESSIPAITGTSSKVACRTFLVYLTVGDYVTCAGYQNSGGALNTSVSGGDQSSMCVKWVSN